VGDQAVIDEIKSDADQRMRKSVEALKQAFGKLRTGRAHAGLLDDIVVPYYGTDTPLKQVASIHVEDARTLVISPWEKNLIPAIEKAIFKSDLGLTPATSADVVRIPMPALTEETRRDLIKHARHEAELARVSIRNVRRDAIADVREFLKEKEITEDDAHRAEDAIQKLTDQRVADVDKVLAQKEEDLLEI
jgi:ribosome recycling factor